MVSTSHRLAAGPAAVARWVRIRTPVLFENGEADMLLIDGKHPQRSRQSRPTGGSRASGRSAAQSLYGRRSGG